MQSIFYYSFEILRAYARRWKRPVALRRDVEKGDVCEFNSQVQRSALYASRGVLNVQALARPVVQPIFNILNGTSLFFSLVHPPPRFYGIQGLYIRLGIIVAGAKVAQSARRTDARW